jgi:ribulose-5-phosphate 4-epimerase/fuculose-1-phosphate aldolase
MFEAMARPDLIQDVVDANRILYRKGILDAFGHVSARHDRDPTRFLMARNLAPGQVQAADILAYSVDSGEPLMEAPPKLYLERYIHSAIYQARPDVMAVVHHHSPAVLPFTIARGVRLRPVCHMCGFLGGGASEGAGDGAGPPVFEIRDHAGDATDLLIRSRELGAALATCLGAARIVLMRGHGATVVAESVKLAVYRSVYAEVNAKLQAQAMALGEVTALSDSEAKAARITVEGQVERPWNLWKQEANSNDA